MTDEYMLPLSYGLDQYLSKGCFGISTLALYLHLHFNKTHKGKDAGCVNISMRQIAYHFDVHPSTAQEYMNKLMQLRNESNEPFVVRESTSQNQFAASKYRIMRNKKMGDFKVLSGYPNSNPNTTPDTTPDSDPRKAPSSKGLPRPNNVKDVKDIIYDQMFLEFWKLYPRKVGKVKAKSAFIKLKPSEDLHREIISGLKDYTNSDDWKMEGGRFIPHPTTFLNGRRWEDEVKGKDESWEYMQKIHDRAKE